MTYKMSMNKILKQKWPRKNRRKLDDCLFLLRARSNDALETFHFWVLSFSTSCGLLLLTAKMMGVSSAKFIQKMYQEGDSEEEWRQLRSNGAIRRACRTSSVHNSSKEKKIEKKNEVITSGRRLFIQTNFCFCCARAWIAWSVCVADFDCGCGSCCCGGAAGALVRDPDPGRGPGRDPDRWRLGPVDRPACRDRPSRDRARDRAPGRAPFGPCRHPYLCHDRPWGSGSLSAVAETCQQSRSKLIATRWNQARLDTKKVPKKWKEERENVKKSLKILWNEITTRPVRGSRLCKTHGNKPINLSEREIWEI